MRRFAVLALVVLAAACGDDDGPTTPSNTIVFTANMTAANEVPPIGNAESSASGTATVTFNVTRSGSTISSGTADMQFSLAGFPSTSTSAILAHVHTGAAGVNGPVLINSGLSAASPVTISAGAGTFTARGIAVEGATIQSIIDNPAGFYFNVHTPLNPGGAVRAQLVRRN